MKRSPKKKSKKTDNRLFLGLGWLWSRPASPDSGAPVDLETIDSWRRGLLGAKRRKEVKRQLANDPRLMRQLEELVAADELLREFDASSQAHESKHNLLHAVRKLVGETLAVLKRPALVGGLAASAVAVLLLVIVLPYQTSPNFGAQLDAFYANLDEPSEQIQVPWTPKIVIRSGTVEPEDTGEAKLNELLGQAFQSGMAEGIRRIESRFPDVRLNLGGYIRLDEPACHLDIGQCERQVELAKASGGWAVAAFLECQNPPDNKSLEALALLPNLQHAWRDLSPENTLSKDIQAIATDSDPCQAAEELLLNWGRPNLPTSATP